MIKKALIAFALLNVMPIAHADNSDLYYIPTLEEQMKIGQFENLVTWCQTDDRGAGEIMSIVHPVYGFTRVIDRSKEPKKPRTTTSPAPRLSIADILGNVSSDVRAGMQITVKEVYDPMTGQMSSREWIINFNASAQLDSGMGEANGKQHKYKD